MQHPGIPFSVSALLMLFVASGCVPQDHGWASLYRPAQQRKIAVIMPANAPSISQEFLTDTNSAGHIGIDVIGKVGMPVIAASSGQVAESFSEPMYGNRVVIDHGPDATGNRTLTVYKHLKDRLVSKGDTVSRGQQIGTMGTTGMLGGGIPHLHFELFREAKPSGPQPADPHLFWANGVGRVTCFDPAASPSESMESTSFRSTYPVPCRAS